MPKVSLAGDGTASFHLPFDARRDDLRILVESTSTLEDWTHAHILFDSGADFPPTADANGWIAIPDTLPPGDKRFYRCRISTLPALQQPTNFGTKSATGFRFSGMRRVGVWC
jgi:hypothetical protein